MVNSAATLAEILTTERGNRHGNRCRPAITGTVSHEQRQFVTDAHCPCLNLRQAAPYQWTSTQPMLLRQTILYLPAQVLGPLFQLLAMVVWTHFLAPAELGVFALIVAAQELIFSSTLFWFSLYTLRHHDFDAEAAAKNRFLNTELTTMGAASLLALGMVLVLPLFVGSDWSMGLLAATGLYTVTRGLVAHLSDRARAEHDTLTYSLMQIVWPVLGFAVALLFVTQFEASATAVLLGYVVAQVAALLIAAGRLSFGRQPFGGAMVIVRSALRYGMPLVVGSILAWIAINALRFIVEWQEGAAAVGLVTVGWGLGQRVSAFASMLVTAAAFPIAVKKAREDSLDAGQLQLQRNGLLLLAALAPACVGLWAIAEPAVRLLIAEPFQDITIAILPFAILAGAVRSVRLHFGEQVFLLRERTMVSLINDLIDAIAATIGTVIGLIYGGLTGAVIGGAIGATLSTIVTLAWGWLAHRFALPIVDSLRIIIATALMAAAVVALSPDPTAFSLTMAIAVGALIYAAALVVLYPDILRRSRDILRKPVPPLPTYPDIVEPKV
jgi:O-antigen/teichoic acid export membrane protein